MLQKYNKSKAVKIIEHLTFKIEHLKEYSYNENSQILQSKYNNNSYNITNTYNNRNWLTQSTSSNSLFDFTLGYLSNGNIATQYLTGSYRSNFPDLKEIKSVYSYDKTNRLKKTEKYSTKYYALEGEYSFDPDGNFLTHTRSFNGDNFNYDYYPYTNRLRKVTGTENQFTYDYNGNMTNDYLNENINISYDHRNLITEINRTNPLEDPPTEIKIRYRYDESGNRTRKTIYQSTIENPPPIPGEGDLPSGWIITKEEYFVRDAQGKEIAIYQGYELDFWNVWGMGNEGRIKSTGTNYFYLKDHLGSIRAVLNESNYLVQALDYDSWGFLARSWDTTATRYKFTGKERDNETGYDYFGARYYDARTGVWSQIEPLYDKYLSFSPYAYAINNPLLLKDINGEDVRAISFESKQTILNTLPAEIRSLVIFDENGFIDKSTFNIINSLSDNYLSLKTLVNNSNIFDIIIDNKFEYRDNDNNTLTIDMGSVFYEEGYYPSPFDPQTKEVGWYGVILTPGREIETYNSNTNNVEIIINKGLSEAGRSQTFSHEAYGHAFLYALNKEHKHKPINENGVFYESNYLLGEKIIRAINETINNMGEIK